MRSTGGESHANSEGQAPHCGATKTVMGRRGRPGRSGGPGSRAVGCPGRWGAPGGGVPRAAGYRPPGFPICRTAGGRRTPSAAAVSSRPAPSCSGRVPRAAGCRPTGFPICRTAGGRRTPSAAAVSSRPARSCSGRVPRAAGCRPPGFPICPPSGHPDAGRRRRGCRRARPDPMRSDAVGCGSTRSWGPVVARLDVPHRSPPVVVGRPLRPAPGRSGPAVVAVAVAVAAYSRTRRTAAPHGRCSMRARPPGATVSAPRPAAHPRAGRLPPNAGGRRAGPLTGVESRPSGRRR
ncbi:hypothetical protein OV320_2737 [Actinobacteria bacterium OV320]|nr:hypothetical protein OV320_2737 [Actinobacteria bacterium OV320]